MKKGCIVNYQMIEAIKLIHTESSNDEKIKKLEELKIKWREQDKIPGTNIKIGNAIVGMEDITVDEIVMLERGLQEYDIYSVQNSANMQYCLIQNDNGEYDFDFSYLEEIATMAREKNKKLVIDSAVIFGDRFPKKIETMDRAEIESIIGIYFEKLISQFGDCIERIDVLNAIYQRDFVDKSEESKEQTPEKFWKEKLGENYGEIVLKIAKEKIEGRDILLCWNEFYLTRNNFGFDKRRQQFLETALSIPELDCIGLQDAFRSDGDVDEITTILDELKQVCENNGIKICITELSCIVAKKDIDYLESQRAQGEQHYKKAVNDINHKIQTIIQSVKAFCESNSDIVISQEGSYSDKFDFNHTKALDTGHVINTVGKKQQEDKILIQNLGKKVKMELTNVEALDKREMRINRQEKQIVEQKGVERKNI